MEGLVDSGLHAHFLSQSARMRLLPWLASRGRVEPCAWWPLSWHHGGRSPSSVDRAPGDRSGQMGVPTCRG